MAALIGLVGLWVQIQYYLQRLQINHSKSVYIINWTHLFLKDKNRWHNPHKYTAIGPYF